MSWTPIDSIIIVEKELTIKVRDCDNQEAFAMVHPDGSFSVITDSDGNPDMNSLTHFRLLEECTLKLFK